MAAMQPDIESNLTVVHRIDEVSATYKKIPISLNKILKLSKKKVRNES